TPRLRGSGGSELRARPAGRPWSGAHTWGSFPCSPCRFAMCILRASINDVRSRVLRCRALGRRRELIVKLLQLPVAPPRFVWPSLDHELVAFANQLHDLLLDAGDMIRWVHGSPLSQAHPRDTQVLRFIHLFRDPRVRCT